MSQKNSNTALTKAYVEEKFDQVDEKFNQIDERFDHVDEKFDQVDERFDQVNEKFDQVMNTLVQIVGDIEAMREDQILALGKDREFESKLDNHDKRIDDLETITHST